MSIRVRHRENVDVALILPRTHPLNRRASSLPRFGKPCFTIIKNCLRQKYGPFSDPGCAEPIRAPVPVRGGIHTHSDVDWWFDHGAARVVLGTIAVKDRHLNRVVAHKALRPEFVGDEVETTRLLREARVSAMLQPLPANDRFLQFDQWVLLGTAVLLLVFLYTGRRLNRLEGGILLAVYGGYVVLSFTVFGG